MDENKGMITVYYDGACPACVKDRDRYEKLAGSAGKNVFWFDITGQKERMHEFGSCREGRVAVCERITSFD